jgi:hypothetical protein
MVELSRPLLSLYSFFSFHNSTSCPLLPAHFISIAMQLLPPSSLSEKDLKLATDKKKHVYLL